MSVARSGPVAVLVGFASRLRYPTLTALVALLFVADLFVPDAIPLADELLLGLATAALVAWKREKQARTATREAGP